MAETTVTDLHDELRTWARGMLPLEAATEMVIRGGYAGPGRRWVTFDDIARRHWIDFAAIPDLSGAMSGGQQRFLRIAASLAVDEPIVLGDEVTGLDRKHVHLVLAAIAHSAGMTEPGSAFEFDEDGTPHRVETAALYSWGDA